MQCNAMLCERGGKKKDVQSVTNFDYMFWMSSYTGDISNWCMTVSPNMFGGARKNF